MVDLLTYNTKREKKEFKTEWDLEKHFFKSLEDPKIQSIIEETKTKVGYFVDKWKDKLHKVNANAFQQYLQESSLLFLEFSRVNNYISYLYTLNTQDQKVIKKMGELENISSDLSTQLLFVDEEYKKIGREGLLKLSENPILSKWKNYLFNASESIKHMLSEDQEKVLIEVGKVDSIFGQLFNEYSNAFEFELDGKTMTADEIWAERESDNEETRRKAHDAINKKFGEKLNQITFGNLYKSVCKDNVASIKLRGYSGVMATRNLSEEMDNEVVDKLLQNVKSNYHLYHTYLKIKAKLLGKSKLDYWDVFAPIPNKGKEVEYKFEDGLKFFLDQIEKFAKDFRTYSEEIFYDGRVSVYPNKGKMSGAYASYDKGQNSFVMLNYTNKLGDVMTLAHELGHAIHGNYSQVQPRQSYHSSLSMAETASIFNETLIFESLMKEISDEDKTYYIAQKLDDIFSTMFRQVMYVSYERECHQRFLDGEELSYEDFNEIWFKNVKEYYGDSVNLTEDMKYGWSIIPHLFNTPFYCYAYSFGNILSFNLYNMYKESTDKNKFVDMYIKILEAGGSKRPKDLLIENGVDITSDDFYTSAFKVVSDLIESISFDKKKTKKK